MLVELAVRQSQFDDAVAPMDEYEPVEFVAGKSQFENAVAPMGGQEESVRRGRGSHG